MESLIGNMLGSYESGKVSRREFVASLTLLTAAAAVPGTASAMEAAAPIDPINPMSVNHIAIGVSDLKKSVDWYTSLFKLKVVQQTEKVGLLQFGNTQLVLRPQLPDRPSVKAGTISHFMFGVAPYDESVLKRKLESFGLQPKKDLESFLVRDPDGLLLQVGDEKMGLDVGYPPTVS